MTRHILFRFIAVLLVGTAMPAYSAVVKYIDEDFAADTIPSGWTVSTEGLSAYAWSLQDSAMTIVNDGSAFGTSSTLITPPTDMRLSYLPYLVLRYRLPHTASGLADSLTVYYRRMEDMPWTHLASLPVTNEETEQIEIPIPYYNSDAFQLGFRWRDMTGLGAMIEQVEVCKTSICTGITDLQVAPGSTDAVVYFMGDIVGEYEYVLATSALANPDATSSRVVQRGTTPEMVLRLTGLSKNTNYYLYVRSTCFDNETGYTPWVSTSFKTKYTVALPYTDGFERYAATSNGYFRPTYWTLGQIGASIAPYCVRTTSSRYLSITSDSYLSFTTTQTTSPSSNHAVPAGAVQYAALPELEVDSFMHVNLRFSATAYAYANAGTNHYAHSIIVGVMEQANDYTTFVPLDTLSVDEMYRHKVFDISLHNYQGKGRYVAFVSAFSKPNLFFIDNVELYEGLSVPSNIQITHAAPSSLTVCADRHGAASWCVRVYPADAYQPGGGLPPDSLLITTQQSLTDEMQIPLSGYAGKGVLVYAAAIDDSDTSKWSFPIGYRIPDVMTCPYRVDFETTTVDIRSTTPEIPYPNPIWIPATIQAAYRGTTQMEVSSAAPVYKGKHLCFGGTGNRLILPLCDSLPSRELRFRLANPVSTPIDASRIEVGVMTDPADTSTYVAISSFEGVPNVYHLCVSSLEESPYEQGYIVITAVAPAHNYINIGSYNALDDIEVRSIPLCREPEQVIATVADTVSLSWLPMGMSLWRVEMDTQEDFSTSAVDTLVSVPHFSTTQLRHNCIYYYRVSAVCDSDEVAAEVGSLVTTCARNLEVPYVEPFEQYGSDAPRCWTIHPRNSAYPQCSNTAMAPHSGERGLYFGMAESRPQRTYMVLPPYEGNLYDLEVSFFLRGYSANKTNDRLAIGVMSDVQDTTTFIPLRRITPPDDDWRHVYLSLSDYYIPSTHHYIALRREPIGVKQQFSTTTWYYPFYIDDLYVGLLSESRADTIMGDCLPVLPSSLLEQPFTQDRKLRKCWKSGQLIDGARYFVSPELLIDSIQSYGLCFSIAPANGNAKDSVTITMGVVTDAEDMSTLVAMDTALVPYASRKEDTLHVDMSFASYIGDYNGEMGRRIGFICSSKDSTHLSHICRMHVRPWSEILADSLTHADPQPILPDTVPVTPPDTVPVTPPDTIPVTPQDTVPVPEPAPLPVYTYPYACDFSGKSYKDWTIASGLMSKVLAGTATLKTDHLTNPWVATALTSQLANISGMAYRVEVYGKTNEWLFSPLIVLPADTAEQPVLRFTAALIDYASGGAVQPGGQPDDRLVVICSRDAGRTWLFEDAVEWSNTGMSDYLYDGLTAAGSDYTIPLTAYSGDTIQLAFYSESTKANADNRLYIDNVRVIPCDSLCQSDSVPSDSDSTIVAPQAIPMRYRVGFDADLCDWQTYGSATLAQVEQGGLPAPATTGWKHKEGGLGLNSAHAQLQLYGTSNNYWLISPLLDLTTSASAVCASLDLALTGTGITWPTYTAEPTISSPCQSAFMLLVSPDGGRTWSHEHAYVWGDASVSPYDVLYDYASIPVSGTRYWLDLSAYRGMQVRLALHAEQYASGDNNLIHVDNLRLSPAAVVEDSLRLCQGEDYADDWFSIHSRDLHLGLQTLSLYQVADAAEEDTLRLMHVRMSRASSESIRLTICEGDSLPDYGISFPIMESTTLSRRLTNVAGCDSLLTIRIEVDSCSIDTLLPDTLPSDTIVEDALEYLSSGGMDAIVAVYDVLGHRIRGAVPVRLSEADLPRGLYILMTRNGKCLKYIRY